MKYTLSVSEEKFLRNFDRKTAPASFLSRFHLPETDRFLGHHKNGRFSICMQKKNRFCLFACTLSGCVQKEKGGFTLSCRFSRPLISGLFLSLWILLLFFTGFQILFREPDFALWFLIPAILCSLPLFFFSKKEKQKLLSLLISMGAEEGKQRLPLD